MAIDYKPVEVEAQQAVPAPIEKRENVATPKPQTSEIASTSFGDAVARATNGALNKDRTREIFQTSGKSFEWDAFKELYARKKDAQAGEKVAQRVADRARSLGVTPAEAWQLDQKGMTDIIDSATRDYINDVQQPELTGMVLGLTTEPDLDRFAADEQEHLVQTFNDYQDIIDAENNAVLEIQAANIKFLQEGTAAGLDSGTIRETLAGLGAEFTPFGFTWPFMWDALADELGIALTTPGEEAKLPGRLMARIKKEFVDLPPEEKIKFRDTVEQFLATNPMAYTDFRKQVVIESLFQDDVLAKQDPDQAVEHMFEDVMWIFELLGWGAVLNFAGRTVGRATNPHVRATNRASKSKALTTLAENFTNPNTDEVLRKYGLTREQMAQSQVNKPRIFEDSMEDVPSGLAEEAERVAKIQSRAETLQDETKSNILSRDDKLTAMDTIRRDVTEAWQGQMREGLSTFEMKEGDIGVAFQVTLGKNSRVGFLSDRTAFEQVRDISPDGSGVRVFTSDGGTLSKFLDGEDAVAFLEEIEKGTRSSTRGNYYVQYDIDYDFQPMDKGLFGEDAVVGPMWLGRARSNLLTPSARFGRQVYEPYLRNFLREQALVQTIDSIVAPIFELSTKKRQNVGALYDWSSNFSRKEGRLASMDEITEAFPDAGSDEIRGLFLVRQFYDVVYHLQNRRLFSNWNSKNYQTLGRNGTRTQYHGEPIRDAAALRDSFDGSGRFWAYDPTTEVGRSFNITELRQFMDEGGTILRTDLPISTDQFTHFTFVAANSNIREMGWNLGKLDRHPLKYIPGYYPRMYEDHVFIEKVASDARVNGRVQEYVQTTHVAATKGEAEKMIRRLTAAEPDFTWRIKKFDTRLSENDRVAADLERFQVEGRLFFDDRNDLPLMNTQGNPADMLDPINALQRTSRMLSRQVSSEDLVKSYKVAWNKQYGAKFGVDTERLRSSQVKAELTDRVQAGEPGAVQALDVWNYIRVMEGATNQGAKWFRRQAINAAEFVAEKTSGVPGARRASTYLVRNAHRVSPVEAAKQLAFFDFLVTRPVRQLVLQSSQHMFIAGLDPTYAGRLQADTMFLLQGAKRDAIELMGGKKVSKQMVARNAALMRMSPEEYVKLSEEFVKSGIAQAVNIHSFYGDLTQAAAHTPQSTAGQIAQTTVNTLTARPLRDAARKYGFELGEQLNVTASYLMALRLYRNEHKGKKLTQISSEDWQAIGAKASDYALAMNRANAADFQYGAWSLPLQFLQFTHKTALTMTRAIAPSFGNKAFSQKQAWQVVAGQFILFGAAGFSMKEMVGEWMAANGLEDYLDTELVDVLEGGTVDWMLDNSMNFAYEKFTGKSEDIDLAWDEFMAPGANILNTVNNFWEMGTEAPLTESFLGPSEVTFSRMLKAYRLARFAVVQEQWTPTERVMRALDATAAGAMSGYSDWMKARLAANHGSWLATSGQSSELEAKWAEILAKGLLGVNPQKVLDSYEIYNNMRDYEDELNSIGKQYASDVTKAQKLYAADQIEEEAFYLELRGVKAILETSLDPSEYQFVMESYAREMNRLRQDRDHPSYSMIDKMVGGLPPTDQMRAFIVDSPIFKNDQDRQVAIDMLADYDKAEDFMYESAWSINQENLERFKPDGR